MEIKIEDYLSQEEMKKIAKDLFIKELKNNYRNGTDIDRFLCNFSYEQVFEIVNHAFNEDLENMINEKVIDIIKDLSSYFVFRKKSEFEKENSVGQDILEKCIKNNENLIEENVKKAIDSYNYSDVKENIMDYVYECIQDRIFKQD